MFRSSKLYVTDWSFGASFSQKSLNCQRMGEPRMSTAICHLLLAGSSAWTCRTLHNAGQIQWAYGTLGLYFAKSVVGVLRYGIPEHQQRLTDGYIKITAWSHLLCNNLFMTDAYTYIASTNTSSLCVGLIHLSWGFGSLVYYSVEGKNYGELIRMNCIFFLISGLCIGYGADNSWMKYASVWYAAFYYTMGKSVSDYLPREEYETLGLGVFQIFMASALTNANMFDEVFNDVSTFFSW